MKLHETKPSIDPSVQNSVSVVLPNYNHGRFVVRALTALTRQVPPPDEIIVVDDGSTDDSVTIIKKFADELTEQRPLIRTIVNSINTGVVAALNLGLEAAKGNYVHFAASDDWLMPGFFALAIEMLQKHPEAGLFCGEAILIDGESGKVRGLRPPVRPSWRVRYINPPSVLRLLARSDNWILTGSAVFRRDAVISAGRFQEKLGSFADGYLSRKIALLHGFCFAPQIVATWCVFRSGVSRESALDLDKATRMLKIVPEHLRADLAFPSWYADLYSNRWCFSTARLALEARPVNRNMLFAMATSSSCDAWMIRSILDILPEPVAKVAILVFLWWKFRPYTFFGVAATALVRHFEKIFGGRDAIDVERK